MSTHPDFAIILPLLVFVIGSQIAIASCEIILIDFLQTIAKIHIDKSNEL